ncbi:MAG: type II toxin-antitoxin system death-on-curing family toxin [Leucobacter sp.]
MQYIELPQALAVSAWCGFVVRDRGLLASALARPAAGLFGEDAYPALELKAAALASSIAQNHALVDGNKRFTLLLTAAFIEINGCSLTLTNDEMFELILSIAQRQLEIDAIAEVLGAHMRAH